MDGILTTGLRKKILACSYTTLCFWLTSLKQQVVQMVRIGIVSGTDLIAVHVHAYTTLCLRDCVALFSCLNITEKEHAKLKELAMSYFRGNWLYFFVTPTVWTLGYVVPVHAEQMVGKYSLGLGLNSMEGWGAKHISIARYSKNTAFLNCWQQLFCHEFISLILLREKGYNTKRSLPSARPSYIPKRVKGNPNFCNCGMQKQSVLDSQCRFCKHSKRCKPLTSL